MKRRDVLQLWEAKWGKLSAEHRERFLERAEVDALCGFPSSIVSSAVSRQQRLSSALECAESLARSLRARSARVRSARDHQREATSQLHERDERTRRLGRADGINLSSLYLRDVGRHALLTPTEELVLAQQIADAAAVESGSYHSPLSGDVAERMERHIVLLGRAAFVKMVCANLRLVVWVARRSGGRGLPFLDRVQEGTLGLMHAITKFEVSRGFRLSTYATWWIRQSISRAVANDSRVIRLPVHVHEQVVRYERAERLLLEQEGEATPDLIMRAASRARVSPARALQLRRWAMACRSLDEITQERAIEDRDDPEDVHPQDRWFEHPEILVDDHETTNLIDCSSLRDAQERIKDALDRLTARERMVVELRFGFADGRIHTLQEVGDLFGITRERVRQIQVRVMKKLKASPELQQAAQELFAAT
jgi:RNA polymerase primary sigma factor